MSRSLIFPWNDGAKSLPPIYVLEVRDKHKPRSAPIRWILVERTETRSEGHDGKLIRARIRMAFQPLRVDGSLYLEDGGFFAGSYSPGFGGRPSELSITAEDIHGGNVMIKESALRGNRIGTHLMNEIVEWAMQWPDASVVPIKLAAIDARADNRERRNKFYANFGIAFPSSAGPLIEGRSLPMLAAQLTPHRTWEENIIVKDVPSYIDELRKQVWSLNLENSRNASNIESLNKTINTANDAPLRWAFGRLGTRAAGLVQWLLGIGVLAFLIFVLKSVVV
ncbi:hypothetical protein [Achromobacter kerstersii]|uniref:hypothetical protein n=1 Tax=Achromobacter kerstersii TaxID=1353890 RepID=UPI0006C583B1|nr:hypothetical protein [Achromobacter kerstersii]CUJ49287.1 Uncharacterised protein [Achromobacter kerstersii]